MKPYEFQVGPKVYRFDPRTGKLLIVKTIKYVRKEFKQTKEGWVEK